MIRFRMCGIVGIFQSRPGNLNEETSRMLEQIRHRGPDSSEILALDEIALGNTRLAIVDIQNTQSQPLTIQNTSLVFNGEIYNYLDIGKELKKLGRPCHTNSDTEVVLNSFLQWGVGAFSKFNGMWSLAIFSHQSRKLYLSRDRLGVKPLYWTHLGDRLAFSSEIKGLLPVLRERNMNYNYFSNSIFLNTPNSGTATPLEKVQQLEPGTFMEVNYDLTSRTVKWWELNTRKPELSETEGLECFQELFKDAVKIRLPNEVSYGFSLSGGLDSNAVVGCAFTMGLTNPKSAQIYNLSYNTQEMNESEWARQSAEIFGSKLQVFQINPEYLLKDIARVTWHQEGIGWNPSILAYDHYYKLLRENKIKVLLEGHGADEVLAGYPGMIMEYLVGKPLFKDLSKLMPTLRMVNKSGNPEVGEKELSNDKEIIQNYLRLLVSSRLRRYIDIRAFVSKLRMETGIFTSELQQMAHIESHPQVFPRSSFKSVTFNHTFHSTLTQVLQVFDRASMAHGVESRAPFLDYRLVELAFSLPDTAHLSSEYTKPLARKALKEFIPHHIRTTVNKKGFGAPLHRIVNAHTIKRYLLSKEMQSIYSQAIGINSKELIRLLKNESRPFTPSEIRHIWQATSFAIWQDRFL